MGKLRTELDRIWGGPFPRVLDYVAGNLKFGSEVVFYLEDDGSGDSAAAQVGRLVRSALIIPVKNGAIRGTGCKLVVPGGETYWASSHWGDSDGWSSRISLGAKTLGLLTGELRHDTLILSDGREFHLSKCEIWFDLSKRPTEARLVRWPDDDTE